MKPLPHSHVTWDTWLHFPSNITANSYVGENNYRYARLYDDFWRCWYVTHLPISPTVSKCLLCLLLITQGLFRCHGPQASRVFKCLFCVRWICFVGFHPNPQVGSFLKQLVFFLLASFSVTISCKKLINSPSRGNASCSQEDCLLLQQSTLHHSVVPDGHILFNKTITCTSQKYSLRKILSISQIPVIECNYTKALS